LRKRTKKAPKRIRKREYLAASSDKHPKYINASNGRLLRRWSLTRKLGTPAEYTRHHYVYTDARKGKNGKRVGRNRAAERAELLRVHGLIPRAGLAKKSWGWVMKKIYDGSNVGNVSWNRIKGEIRDPRTYVNGEYKASSKGAFARILNKLDYIRDALPPGAVAAAIDAASKRMEYNIRKRIERLAK
jgi:hypothetical protein